MKEQLTDEFEVVHATVHYPDNTSENVEYTEIHRHGEHIEFFDIDLDGWSVWNYSSNTYLSSNTDPESRVILSMNNVKKIETNWVEELVAVAEVEIVTEKAGLLSTEKKVAEDDKEPDVTIYEKHEWEAINDEA